MKKWKTPGYNFFSFLIHICSRRDMINISGYYSVPQVQLLGIALVYFGPMTIGKTNYRDIKVS